MMMTVAMTSRPVDCRSVLSTGMRRDFDVVFALSCTQCVTAVYQRLASALARALAIDICLSVRLSVKRVHCDKAK